MLQKHSLLYFIFIVFCANALSQNNSNDYCENATALCFNETIKSTNLMQQLIHVRTVVTG